MKLSRIFSIGLVALTALSLSAPNVSAHNTLKYTGIPFIVPGACSPGTASVVSINRTASVTCTGPTTGFAGWEMFCSSPSTGTLPSTTTGTFAQGTLTCNFTSNTTLIPFTGSNPGTANCEGFLQVNNAGTTEYLLVVPTISGNTMTMSCINGTFPSAPVIVAFFGVGEGPTSVTSTFNNFRYNNAPVLLDATNVDSSSAENAAGTFNFCE